MFIKIVEKYIAEISGVILFIIYLSTMAPGLVQIDSGELAAVITTLGIAHPSGYPLFTMAGYIFTKVFFFFSPIYAVNLFACLLTTAGFYFLTKLNIELYKEFSFTKADLKTKQKKTKNIKSKTPDKEISELSSVIIASVVSALTTAFFITVWMQSTSIEVYSLHYFLINLTLFLFVKAVNLYKSNESLKFLNEKYFILFAIALGLCFTNHLTSILLIPGIAVLYFMSYGFEKYSIKRIFLMLIPFFIVLLIYLYFPIRAGQNPEINWGNPVDFERFKRHFMGWQYQSWIFSSTAAASKQFNYFFSNLPEQLGYFGLIFIPGIITLFIYNKKIFTFITVLFISTLLYSINYDISDIDAYFLLAYLSLGLMMTPFLLLIVIVLREKTENLKYLLFIIPLLMLFINYPRADESRNVQVHEYSEAALNALEPNAVVMSYLWDFFVSPTYYFQFTENKRKDVAVIDKELVRRSWYFNQMRRNYPDVIKKIEPLIEQFLPELKKFERNDKYNAQFLETNYYKILQEIIIKNVNERPVYLSPELVTNEMANKQLVLPDSLNVIPHKFFYRVIKDTSYITCGLPEEKIQFSEKDNYYTRTIKNLVAVSFANRALYEKRNNQIERAKIFLKKAIEVEPTVIYSEELNNLIN